MWGLTSLRRENIMSSLGQATVCKVEKIENHPNADKLDLVHFDGVTVCSQKGLYSEGQLVIYVPPDMYKIGDHPSLSFLTSPHIKARCLRGVMSYGLIIDNVVGAVEGENVTEQIGLMRYEDWQDLNQPQNTKVIKGPSGQVCYTDIKSFKKYHYLFENTEVVITEKIHGQNARYVVQDGKLYVGSRTRWIEEDNSSWWEAARQYKLYELLSKYPNIMLAGEVYGWVQDIRYNHDKGKYSFIAFDCYDLSTGKYLNYDHFSKICNDINIPVVPVKYFGNYPGVEYIKKISEEDSALYPGLSEGIVIKPSVEIYNSKIGRLILKNHSDRYLTR